MLKIPNFRLIYTSQLFIKQELKFHTQTTTSAATSNVVSENEPTDAEIEFKNARPYDEIPNISVFGLIRLYMPGGKLYKKTGTREFMEISAKNYGDIVRLPSLFGKPAMVFTHNPNDFEHVFRNEGIWPTRLGLESLHYHRNWHQANFYKGVEGLFVTQGEEWGKFRSVVNPVLMQPRNVRLYYQKLAHVNSEFVQRIKKIRNPETNEMPENFEEEINRFSFESVSLVALDTHLGLLRSDTIDIKVKKLFDKVTEFMVLSGELDSRPATWKIIPNSKFKRVLQALDEVHNITLHYINEAIERLENEQKLGFEKPENEKGVLEKLIKIDRKVAIVMAIDMLLAGVDTTTSLFTGIMLCLAKNPEKQAKLREEILRILPEKDSEFSEESLKDMTYLRACIKEGVRMFPVAEANLRVVQRDVVLSGYRVPKGVLVVTPITMLNRNEKYYRHANEFLPERWLRNSGDLKLNNPFINLPFGFGPRSCIGKRIAELEMELCLARIFRNFYVNFNYPVENAFKSALINIPNVPLKFQFTDLEK